MVLVVLVALVLLMAMMGPLSGSVLVSVLELALLVGGVVPARHAPTTPRPTVMSASIHSNLTISS